MYALKMTGNNKKPKLKLKTRVVATVTTTLDLWSSRSPFSSNTKLKGLAMRFNLRTCIMNEIPFFLGKRDLTCWLLSRPSGAFNTNIEMDKFLHIQDHPQKHWNSKPSLFQTIIWNWNPQRNRTVAGNMHDIIADHTRNSGISHFTIIFKLKHV